MNPRDPSNPHQAVYVISVAAELTGVHPQTLRIYERKGILEPTRTTGGSRRYSQADIDRLLRVQELTGEGLNLAGVQRVMALEDEIASLKRELAEARTQTADAVRTAKRARTRHEIVPLRQDMLVYRSTRRR